MYYEYYDVGAQKAWPAHVSNHFMEVLKRSVFDSAF